ncbi:MAG: alpha/beta hydrolase fold protein [Marmoricola sp.]|nr:alpha/beta hydrolase fold protein [Marmoricola sp.]
MSASAAPLRIVDEPDDGLALRFYSVTASDGTELQAWTNDVAGPTVLLCNGLGTNPYAWPALLDPSCGVHVISWNHRGTGGSERPADPGHVGIDAFVEDALAVLDDAGVEACTAMGWSMGVNTAFELAFLHPDRVTGLFAVAGVPGGTFASMLAPLGIPRFARAAITVNLARAMQLIGKPATLITTRLPIGPKTIAVLSHTGFMFPVADAELTAMTVHEMLKTPVDWYMHLAVQTSKHLRISLREIRVPTTFVAGHWDVLASSSDMRTAAARIEGAEYVEFNGSHFIALEKPDEVHELLLDLLDRVDV